MSKIDKDRSLKSNRRRMTEEIEQEFWTCSRLSDLSKVGEAVRGCPTVAAVDWARLLALTPDMVRSDG